MKSDCIERQDHGLGLQVRLEETISHTSPEDFPPDILDRIIKSAKHLRVVIPEGWKREGES
jgi:hypothetical protein